MPLPCSKPSSGPHHSLSKRWSLSRAYKGPASDPMYHPYPTRPLPTLLQPFVLLDVPQPTPSSGPLHLPFPWPEIPSHMSAGLASSPFWDSAQGCLLREALIEIRPPRFTPALSTHSLSWYDSSIAHLHVTHSTCYLLTPSYRSICKLNMNVDFCLFCSLLYAQCLEQCLAHATF